MPKKSYNKILDEHLHILVAQGNHEAFDELIRRYHKHAINLSKEILFRFPNTGVSLNDLVAVSSAHFLYVLSKFVVGRSSFYSFWRESATQVIMDYLIENSYGAEAFVFCGSFSLDQSDLNQNLVGEFLNHTQEEKQIKKLVFETKTILYKYKAFFNDSEKMILNLVLQGFSLKEISSIGVLAKSQIYLTYKSAIIKLKNYIEKEKLNVK